MKYLLTFAIVAAIVSEISCDIPNVFEFCSALMSDRRTSCDKSTCQGIPGKRGQKGPSGSRGIKGDTGATGSPRELEEKVKRVEAALKIITSSIPSEIKNVCAMGMKSRAIPDSAISVSSEYSPEYNGRHGRLDEQQSSGLMYAAWHPQPSQIGEWFQVDFGVRKSVAGVVSQGRPPCCNQWTTSYKVKVANSTDLFQSVTENGSDKIFKANTDDNTRVTNIFPTPITCRYIRIYPQTWNNVAAMRLEFIRGECFSLY
uniref:lactadherin-like n=1 Tax=Styela clava TaxID=7725 RepID=UPI001939756E|nr:lactadherin-like [Styela clava]